MSNETEVSSPPSGAALLELYDETVDRLGLPRCEPLRAALAQSAHAPPEALRLHSASLGASGAQALVPLLLHDSALGELHLDNNQLGNDGASLLAAALLDHPALYRLSLGYNEIGARGLQALSELVASSPALFCLDLSGNSFWSRLSVVVPASMSALAPLGRALAASSCRLQLLILDQVDIDVKGLSALAEGLSNNTSLMSLRLGENELGPRAAIVLAAILRRNRTLTSLDLRDNKLGDTGAQALASALVMNESLRCLVLWNNHIGPNGVIAMAEPLAAADASSADERNTATGCTSRSVIEILDLGGNSIGVSGLEALREALVRNRTLHTLGLANSRLGDAGGIELAGIVEGNAYLQRLDLRRNSLQVAGLIAIHLAMKTNHVLQEVAIDVSSSRLAEEEKLLQESFVQEIKDACAANRLAAKKDSSLGGSWQGLSASSQANTAMAGHNLTGAIELLSKLGTARASVLPPCSPCQGSISAPAPTTVSVGDACYGSVDVAQGPNEDTSLGNSATLDDLAGVSLGSHSRETGRLSVGDESSVSSHAAALGAQHDARLRQLGATDTAIAVPLLGAGEAIRPAVEPSRCETGCLRILQWNVLARGLADDGFVVDDVIGGDNAPSSQPTNATRPKDHVDAYSPHVHTSHAETMASQRRNLLIILDAQRRWARIRQVIATYAPDIVTLQELDFMSEAVRSLSDMGYESGLPGSPPPNCYIPPHCALSPSDDLAMVTMGDEQCSAVSGPRVGALFEALKANGRAFGPKVASTLRRKIPEENGCTQDETLLAVASSAETEGDGVAVFWKRDSWQASSLEFFVREDRGKISTSLRVGLTRLTDGAAIDIICSHLPSGSSPKAEVSRLSALNQPTLTLRLTTMHGKEHVSGPPNVVPGPSMLNMLAEAARGSLPTIFCVDANSDPLQEHMPLCGSSHDRVDKLGSVWTSLRDIKGVRSIWDHYYDATGKCRTTERPVTTNKIRGPGSLQMDKIGKHAFLCIDHIFYTDSGLSHPAHAYGPVAFMGGTDEARAHLLPSVGIPSDHYPVIVDLRYAPHEPPSYPELAAANASCARGDGIVDEAPERRALGGNDGRSAHKHPPLKAVEQLNYEIGWGASQGLHPLPGDSEEHELELTANTLMAEATRSRLRDSQGSHTVDVHTSRSFRGLTSPDAALGKIVNQTTVVMDQVSQEAMSVAGGNDINLGITANPTAPPTSSVMAYTTTTFLDSSGKPGTGEEMRPMVATQNERSGKVVPAVPRLAEDDGIVPGFDDPRLSHLDPSSAEEMPSHNGEEGEPAHGSSPTHKTPIVEGDFSSFFA